MENNDVEIVLGHFLVAFGQGACHMRFTSDAVVEARRLCLPLAKAVHQDMDKHRNEVLEVVEAMGRVAAALVTDDGRVDMTAEDVRSAITKVVEHRDSRMCILMRRIIHNEEP